MRLSLECNTIMEHICVLVSKRECCIKHKHAHLPVVEYETLAHDIVYGGLACNIHNSSSRPSKLLAIVRVLPAESITLLNAARVTCSFSNKGICFSADVTQCE